MTKTTPRVWLRQPSWWVVVISGALVAVFVVASIRELMNSRNVSRQVTRLRSQVATEQQRQRRLQDLIDYLGSPTFQEQEARLKLGLKKSGERVIVVPPEPNATNGSTSNVADATDQPPTGPAGHADRWWQYFFAPRSSSQT